MNPNHTEKINSYNSVHFLSNSEFYAYLYKFGTKHEYIFPILFEWRENGRLRYFRKLQKQGFHTVRCRSFTWDAFCLCIGCFSWASKSLNNRASSSVLLVDESLVSDS